MERNTKEAILIGIRTMIAEREHKLNALSQAQHEIEAIPVTSEIIEGVEWCRCGGEKHHAVFGLWYCDTCNKRVAKPNIETETVNG